MFSSLPISIASDFLQPAVAVIPAMSNPPVSGCLGYRFPVPLNQV